MSDKIISPVEEKVIDLAPLLAPITIFLSSLIIAGSVLFGINQLLESNKTLSTNLSTAISKIQVSGTGTGTQPAAAEPVLDDEKKKTLWDNSVVKFGKADAKVMFVEFSDPSCPYCHVASGLNINFAGKDTSGNNTRFTTVENGGTYKAPVLEMKKLVEQGKASYIFSYTNGHGNGLIAAQALYCAFDQNKFWQAHDKLMTKDGYNLMNPTENPDYAKKTDAEKAALNPVTMKSIVEFLKPVVDVQACMDAKKFEAKVNEHNTAAASYGVTGTPGFYVNSKFYGGAYSFSDMTSTIADLIK